MESLLKFVSILLSGLGLYRMVQGLGVEGEGFPNRGVNRASISGSRVKIPEKLLIAKFRLVHAMLSVFLKASALPPKGHHREVWPTAWWMINPTGPLSQLSLCMVPPAVQRTAALLGVRDSTSAVTLCFLQCPLMHTPAAPDPPPISLLLLYPPRVIHPSPTLRILDKKFIHPSLCSL